MTLKLLQFALLALLAGQLYAADTIRIGTLKFGTVNWELDVVQHHQLDRKQNISLAVTTFANNQTSKIAFQGGEVDLIVTDWIWVSRTRHQGESFSFIPYSTALGAVMVPAKSKAQNLKDLRGLRFGVAGGAYDKSWLLLQSWTQKYHQLNPISAFDVQYAAPPLLNGQIEHGNLDAVLNFWHYCARLEAQGYRRLIEMEDVIKQFIGGGALPMVGYMFKESWAQNGLAERFNTAVREAREILRNSDAEWERLRPMMRVKSDADLLALRNRYRAGIPQRWGQAERENASKLFDILAAIGGKTLTGKHNNLADGTFWDGVRF